MKKLTSLLLGGLLVVVVAACNNAAKTSSSAPNTDGGKTASPAATNNDKSTVQANQNDATDETRRKQLNADIQAREQRNNMGGDKSQKMDSDIKSQVRSKLEANLPAAALAIDAKDGAVTVTGTVANADQLQKVEPLAKEIGGVKSVVVKATVAGAQPDAPKPGSDAPMKDRTGK